MLWLRSQSLKQPLRIAASEHELLFTSPLHRLDVLWETEFQIPRGALPIGLFDQEASQDLGFPDRMVLHNATGIRDFFYDQVIDQPKSWPNPSFLQPVHVASLSACSVGGSIIRFGEAQVPT